MFKTCRILIYPSFECSMLSSETEICFALAVRSGSLFFSTVKCDIPTCCLEFRLGFGDFLNYHTSTLNCWL